MLFMFLYLEVFTRSCTDSLHLIAEMYLGSPGCSHEWLVCPFLLGPVSKAKIDAPIQIQQANSARSQGFDHSHITCKVTFAFSVRSMNTNFGPIFFISSLDHLLFLHFHFYFFIAIQLPFCSVFLMLSRFPWVANRSEYRYLLQTLGPGFPGNWLTGKHEAVERREVRDFSRF